MRSGDTVRRKDGTLTLIVGVVDGQSFMAVGWPPVLEWRANFNVIREATPEEEIKTLRDCAKIGGPDFRASIARAQLRERGISEVV